jgi:hypothetical protein
MVIELPGLRAPLPKSLSEHFKSSARPLLDRSAPQENRRRRIWEISGHLHCSIIGTCLTTTELRQIFIKMGLPGVDKETDHELHGRAVLLAGRREVASKLLQKALDRRHRSAITQFAKVRDAGDLETLWAGAVQRADIPGGYWAVLTHQHATEDLVRKVFGEVHMLSHLVGAANRADIRRLHELEAENASLQEKVARQQGRLREAIVTRDATIADLNGMLARMIAARHGEGATAAGPGEPAPGDEGDRATTARLVADLRRRLSSEAAARERAERRLQGLTEERDAERKQRVALERRAQELGQELESVEAVLGQMLPASDSDGEVPGDLAGTTLLYVGGRAHHVSQIRKLAERCSARFLHHDGGIDDRSGLLEGLVARADLSLFPVDCVSHNAVAVVKRISRGANKPFVALRGSGLTSFAAALRSIAAGQARNSPSRTAEQARAGG